jgi:hypothetical protein
MRPAVTPRRGLARPLSLCALVVSLVACATLSRNTVVINERADARLAITVTQGLFTTTARIGPREAGPFVIDSGADHLYLDSELAKTLNPASWGAHDSAGRQPKVKWGELATFVVGPLTLQHTVVGVMDLSAASAAFGARFAGLLGYPFFANAVVEVDYPQRSIACFAPKTYRLPRGHWQPLTPMGNLPTLTARLEGHIEGRFLVDTGNTSTVFFFPAFTQTHALLHHRDVQRVKQTSVRGDADTLAGRIAWFEFAGHRFEQPLVQFALPNSPHAAPTRLAGVIGRGFLQGFIVVFNYPESKIALLPK